MEYQDARARFTNLAEKDGIAYAILARRQKLAQKALKFAEKWWRRKSRTCWF
jgi:hypothetical protein